ncbi:hypothetical protein [Amycolatopsis sp. lyj-109]|uniref:hypothetical protein n=1 Tax=Amycolatopsis sp. lyj-109 TaxID=2789287 RepID=UPI00397A2090
MADRTAYRIMRHVGGVVVSIGFALLAWVLWDGISHHHALVSLADWGRPSSRAGILGYGLGVTAFGLMLRLEPKYEPWRDSLGRLLHVVFIVVTVEGFLRLGEVGARFSAPPEAGIGHASADEMRDAMLQYGIVVMVAGLLARWVSGFWPLLSVTLKEST